MAFDLRYLLALQHFREAIGGAFNDLFVFLSDISYGVFIFMIACVLFWAADKRTGRAMFLNLGISRFLMQFLKLTFCVYRPWVRSAEIKPLETASGYSFPSGHAVTSSTNYGTLISRYRKHMAFCVLMAVLIVLTMFSRNYIGVHTPQDVLVGALIGIAVVIGGSFAWRALEDHPKWDWLVPALGVLLSAAFLIYINFKTYPMDYDEAGKLLVDPQKMRKDGFKDVGRFLGITVAWFLEKKFVDFSTDVPVGTKVTRCVFGIFILLLYEQVLMPAVTGAITDVVANSWVSFEFTFLELLLLILLYPAAFQAWERHFAKRKQAAEAAETAETVETTEETETKETVETAEATETTEAE